MGSPHLPPPPLLDPAWYPDPTGRYEARYWDGRKWTSHISHYGATGADPLIRARWDHWWVRIIGRVALWAAIIGVGYWAYSNYWPSSDRDLEAEQALMNDAALVATDLPAGEEWLPSVESAVSPLGLELDDDGNVPLVACQPMSDHIVDASDEPGATRGFDAGSGLQWVGYANTIAGGAGFAKSYLDDLRDPAAGECLSAVWLANSGVGGFELESTQAMSEPSYGDEAVWWRISGTDTSGAFGLNVVVDLVYVRVDRVVVEFSFSGAVEAVGVDVQREVISSGVRRVDLLLTEYDADDAEEDEDGESDPADELPDPSDDG